MPLIEVALIWNIKSSSSSCPAKGAASSKSFENGTKIKVPSNILPPVIFKKSNCNSFS
jgi:hypothetical protein